MLIRDKEGKVRLGRRRGLQGAKLTVRERWRRWLPQPDGYPTTTVSVKDASSGVNTRQ